MQLGVLLQKTVILACRANAKLQITGVSCDSRRTQKGELFVAVAGCQTDGAQYIAQALENGAAAVVTEGDCPAQGIRVPSARLALAQLSAAFYGYPAEKLKIIGVTGTNGKTSVTWLLQQVLTAVTGQKIGLIGTVENHLGDRILPAERTTPQSNDLHRMLAQMVDAGCTHCVMEVSSHAIDQCRVGCIPFAVGAFTNLTEDHLDYHGTMAAYAAAKAALMAQSEKVVLNRDDPWYPHLCDVSSAKTLTVSARQGADIQAEEISYAANSVCFTAVTDDARIPVRVPSPGSFTVYNGLTVLGIVRMLGLPMDAAAAALENVKPVRGRVEVFPMPGKPFTVIIDYAHTPDGMEQVLSSLRPFCKGRLIALFGCGGDRERAKRPEMGRIATQLADFVIITSDNPRNEPSMRIISDILQGVGQAKNYKVLENRAQAVRYTIDIAKKDDIIVLLGKGHEQYQEIMGRKLPLDEREILRNYLTEMR